MIIMTAGGKVYLDMVFVWELELEERACIAGAGRYHKNMYDNDTIIYMTSDHVLPFVLPLNLKSTAF
jgi:hypothetical protein